jgi:hypothetical protein
VVGVPVIWPVAVEKLSPVGRVAPLSANDTVPVPPDAVTGVNGVAAVLTVRVVEGTAWVVVRPALTVRLKVLDEVCGVGVVWSVAVTVKVVADSVVVGVPVIWPVAVEKLRPVGRVAPLSAKEIVPVPPEAVTGVKGVATAFIVRVVEGRAWVVVRAPFTVRVVVEPATPVIVAPP